MRISGSARGRYVTLGRRVLYHYLGVRRILPIAAVCPLLQFDLNRGGGSERHHFRAAVVHRLTGRQENVLASTAVSDTDDGWAATSSGFQIDAYSLDGDVLRWDDLRGGPRNVEGTAEMGRKPERRVWSGGSGHAGRSRNTGGTRCSRVAFRSLGTAKSGWASHTNWTLRAGRSLKTSDSDVAMLGH